MWAKSAKRANGYKDALKGAKPVKDPKTKRTKKLIWGWEKLVLATRSNEKYRDTYFLALYHVAECRMEYGLLLNNKKAIESAGKEIRNLRKRDADFSGMTLWKTRFGELENRVKQNGG